MKLKLSRILDLLFGDKTPKVTSEIDVLVGELESIANSGRSVQYTYSGPPIVEWGCPTCESKWLGFAYSREFIPIYCTYCGIKFNPMPESVREKVFFIYEKAKGGE